MAEKEQIETIRGGLPAAVVGAAERALRDAAALQSQYKHQSGVHPHDPLHGLKRGVGAGLTAISFDQAQMALREGRYGEAVTHSAIAATGIPIVSDKAAQAIARQVNQVPGARQVAATLSQALDKARISTGHGPVPAGGALLTAVTGGVAVLNDWMHGDYVKAGGDLLVTGTVVVTVVGGLVAGSAACGTEAVATGLAAPLTGAACARAAQTATFAASEGASEIVAQTYNKIVGREVVRGSSVGTIFRYVADRLSPTSKEAVRDIDLRLHLDKVFNHVGPEKPPFGTLGGTHGVEIVPGCWDITEWHDATTQLVGIGCPAPRDKPLVLKKS